MKILLIVFFAAFAAAAFIRADHSTKTAGQPLRAAINQKIKYAVRCSPDLSALAADDSSRPIPLLQGWGNYHMPVTTAIDSATIYFQQGINMYYGFHVIEALASFDKAVAFDSTFAMGYWGKALSYGPNINDFGYSASPDALAATARAKALYGKCTAEEKDLIDAMQVRYAADSTQSRETLNQLYADAMKKAYHRFPKNADIAALYVDALMVQHPWDLYYKNYQAKEWTHEIVQTLETLLAKYPRHPGAAHYYIHAIEASAHPEKGMAVAKVLPQLMPGVAHLVHMPSHIYIRSGYYDIGEKVNAQAVTGYYHYLEAFPAVVNNSALYLIHNLHMQATCANMDGNFSLSMKSSVDCKNSFDSSWQNIPDYLGIFIQYVYMTPYLTQIRFGKWNDVLNTPASPADHVYATLLWHYGRGLAFARKHDFAGAGKQLDTLQQMLGNAQLKAPAPSYANPGIAGALVAEKILQGVIAEENNHLTEATSLLTTAVVLEDSMIYNEPKDWVHPVRQYLGNVLLKAKKYKEAAAVYEQDLVINPNNGWSLTGLADAYMAMGNKQKGLTVKQKAAKAFAKTDTKIMHSVF